VTDLRLFNNGEFEIQVTPVGDSFTVGAPGLARALGIRDAFNLIQNLPEDEKGYLLVSTPGGDQHVWHVTEPGFYRVIAQRQAARVKNADTRAQVERFQRWVFADVLPTIRRTGGYHGATGQHEIPQSYADALELAAKQAREIESKDKRLAVVEPMAEQAALHRAADGLIAVGDFANKLMTWAKRDHGIKVKHLEVWDFLGQIGLLIRGNTVRHNQPTAFGVGPGLRPGQGNRVRDEHLRHPHLRIAPADPRR
jgi:anti-repressor protein